MFHYLKANSCDESDRIERYDFLSMRIIVVNEMNALYHVDDLVQDCSNSIVNAQELLQSCTKFVVLILVSCIAMIRRCRGVYISYLPNAYV